MAGAAVVRKQENELILEANLLVMPSAWPAGLEQSWGSALVSCCCAAAVVVLPLLLLSLLLLLPLPMLLHSNHRAASAACACAAAAAAAAMAASSLLLFSLQLGTSPSFMPFQAHMTRRSCLNFCVQLEIAC